MMYSRLTEEELNKRVIMYMEVKKLNPSDLQDCEVLFHSDYDFMSKHCDYKIVDFNEKFILVTTVDNLCSIEPFYIQVDDFGFLLDEFFNSFIEQYSPSEEYYILESDYKILMDRVCQNGSSFVIENYF